jgi:leukotriene-A4 hydrolase
MRIVRFFCLLGAGLFFQSAASATAAPGPDPHSYANLDDFRTRHLALDLTADFDRKQLIGSATLDLERLNPQARTLVLDTRALVIRRVETATISGAFKPTRYRLSKADAVLGSALRIIMPADAIRVRVRYHTASTASGLQWLTPQQTAGKTQPMLFTQSEAIHARSWVPVQDSPGVRITYEARIHTPKALRAVMSASNDPDAPLTGDFRFTMEQPIPSYLLALAVGDLHFAATGSHAGTSTVARTGIYTEPVMLQKAAREFEDTEAMIEQAERLYGPYQWGRYDLLILPPSFPYGGMENPRLTFASPTVVVGDKSLVSLVAHELAHSWSGNLVTNARWRDFWLNEGFTSYATNRIMEAVFGPERADMERVQEAEELRRDFAEVPDDQKPLAPKTVLQDPDDVAQIVVYNKGSLFLYNLERAYGRAVFDPFLKSWFTEHAFTSQTSEAFFDFLKQRLLQANPGVMTEAEAHAWIFDAPIPADAVFPHSEVFAKVDAVRTDWLAGRLAVSDLPVADWNVLHWTYFLDQMPASVTTAQLTALDAAKHLTQSQNGFLLRSWLTLAIRHRVPGLEAATERHLVTVGRRYLIGDVYEALAEQDLPRAQAIFAKARLGYHPYTQNKIAAILRQAALKPH